MNYPYYHVPADYPRVYAKTADGEEIVCTCSRIGDAHLIAKLLNQHCRDIANEATNGYGPGEWRWTL